MKDQAPVVKYNYDVTATKTLTTRFSVCATSQAKAEAMAKEITKNHYLEIQYPVQGEDFTVQEVTLVDEYKPYYVVTKGGNYFRIHNFQVDLSKAECYGCPTEDAMFAVLKIVHGLELDECQGSEFSLVRHDNNKYEWFDATARGEVFQVEDINEWLRKFEF